MTRLIMLAAVFALVVGVTAAYSDSISGTNGDDVIIGTSSDDAILGLKGNDVLDGRGGGDSIWGGPGNDDVWGDIGSDRLYGGCKGSCIAGTNSGVNLLSGEDGGDTLGADNAHFDQVACGPGSDTAWVDPIDDFGPDCEKVIENGTCIRGCSAARVILRPRQNLSPNEEKKA